MKTVIERTEKIPSYALSYVVNGDASGLEEKDLETIDSFMDKFFMLGTVIVSPQDSEEYFTDNPAFGLPCMVVDTDIIVLTS